MIEFDYPAAARSIALNLRKFCDESEPYPLMIANAARRAAESHKQLLDALRELHDFAEIDTHYDFADRSRAAFALAAEILNRFGV